MIFLQHDLYSNFSGIKKSKDNNLMKEMLFSEIAKILVFHKKEIIQNIQNLGYTLPDTRDKTIVDFVVTMGGKEKPVAEMLAGMIQKYNTDDGERKSGAVLDIVGDVANGIMGIFQAKEEGKTQRAADQSALMQQMLAIKAAESQNSGISTGAVIGIVAAIFVVTGVSLYFILKK